MIATECARRRCPLVRASKKTRDRRCARARVQSRVKGPGLPAEQAHRARYVLRNA